MAASEKKERPRLRGKRVLSGVQPSGVLHLGNYFGALRQFIDLQEGNQAAYFMADLHSLTSVHDAKRRRELTLGVALDFLALGVDPKRSVLYRQSDFPEVTELAWILTTVTPMGLLQRCVSYKEKIEQGLKPDHGLFAYPVLQAADILIWRADHVPVGQDQKQHLELTRDVAVKFNLTYGEVLQLPEPYILDETAVVPGTDGRKMSKTMDNGIEMFAAEKVLRKQVMGIVTDSKGVDEAKDPETSTIFQLYALFANPEERAAMAHAFRTGGLGYGDAKKALYEKVLERFGPARARRSELESRPDTVEDILRDGAARARAATAELMDEVRAAAGLGPPR
ncbi:MAG TPA: tryptophan--tRNA ligase [Myxococcota bacterium]|nr:tryptophan--tRNA ligase [Myxococcota bacterium]